MRQVRFFSGTLGLRVVVAMSVVWGGGLLGEGGRSLKEAVGGRYQLGVGVSHVAVGNAEDADLIREHFGIVTPENCMKPQSIHPGEGEWRFGDADRFADFARETGLGMVGHCLVWAKDDRTDAWMKEEGGQLVSRETLLRRIEEHVGVVVGRYADVATMWDVVNEAIGDGDEGLLRESVYSRVAGMDFVVAAFKAARAADPDAVLIYNDYNCHKPGKREKLIEFLKRVMAAGAPVDAYGMQGHFELGDDSIPQLRETFDELRKLGLKVVVSELDIDVVTRGKWWADGGKYRDELASYDPYREGLPREVERRQVRQYVALFELFDEYSDMIERVSFWNLHDGQSWLNYFPWRRTNYPLLFDRERKPKPVFDVVYRTLRNQAQEHVGVERKDANSVKAHEDLLAKTRQGRVDVYFQGDSITRRWGATDYPQLLDHWRETFHGWNAANFAWGGDSTHNMLWRMQHGELEGVDPRVVVLQAGANNLPWRGAASADRVDDVVGGVRTLVDEFQQRFPGAEIILTAMFPRSQNPDLRPAIEEINERLEALAEGRGLRFLNINAELMDGQGALRQEMSRDGLHLEKPGYEVWGRALRPVLEEILGPRSGEDLAPPPTGDPSAGAGRGALGG